MTRPAIVLLLVILAGCSDTEVATYPVTGIVQLRDGTPVETGTIEFTRDDGLHTARGDIGKDGRFSLTTFQKDDGAVAGHHKAVVVQLISTEDLPAHKHNHGPTVDPVYGQYRRSGLEFTVVEDGENDFEVIVSEVKLSE